MQTNEEIREKICEGNRYKTGSRCFLTKAANPLLLHLPLRILLLLLPGHSGPQNKWGPGSSGSRTETARLKLHRTEQITTIVQAFRKIRSIHALHSHQGAFQLLQTYTHARTTFTSGCLSTSPDLHSCRTSSLIVITGTSTFGQNLPEHRSKKWRNSAAPA